jgi:raffinose/stachyose/melibiose transport system substrate-binding protein
MLQCLSLLMVLAIVLSACAAPPAAPAPAAPAATSAPAATAAPAAPAPTSAPAPTAAPPPTTAAAPAATTAPAPIQAPAAAATKLTFWALATGEGRLAAFKQALTMCQGKYPTIAVEPTFYNYDDYSKAMPAALAADNPPDFSFADPTAPNMPNYVAAGQILPIADFISQYGWDKKVQSGVITFYDPLYGDKSYGVPLISAERGIFYNKDLLKQLGGTVPKTMDEFEALLAKAKAAGLTPLAMGNSDKYGADLYWEYLFFDYLANGDWKAFTSGTMKQQAGVPWGGDAMKQAMTKFIDWKAKGYFNADFASLGSGDLHTNFALGKILFYSHDTSLNAAVIKDEPKFEVGFMNWPRIYADKPLLTLSDPGNLLVIPKGSKHPKEAAQIIDCLLAPEVGMMFAANGDIPLQQGIDLNAVKVPAAFIKDQLAAVGDQSPIGWLNYMAPPDFPDKQGSELQKLLAGDVTVDAYVTNLQKIYDDAIKNK